MGTSRSSRALLHDVPPVGASVAAASRRCRRRRRASRRPTTSSWCCCCTRRTGRRSGHTGGASKSGSSWSLSHFTDFTRITTVPGDVAVAPSKRANPTRYIDVLSAPRTTNADFEGATGVTPRSSQSVPNPLTIRSPRNGCPTSDCAVTASKRACSLSGVFWTTSASFSVGELAASRSTAPTSARPADLAVDADVLAPEAEVPRARRARLGGGEHHARAGTEVEALALAGGVRLVGGAVEIGDVLDGSRSLPPSPRPSARGRAPRSARRRARRSS